MIHTLNFRAMGCSMLVALDRQGPRPASRLEQAPVWFEAWEQALSRFRPDSELSMLNDRAGQWTQVSEPLWQVFQASLDVYHWSQELVNPAVSTALTAAGYDRSFERLTLEGAGAPLPAAGGPIGLEGLDWDPAARAICLPQGMRLDFGGIAKGWSAQQAARRLGAYGPALVDAGGDIAISGLQASGEAWAVGVEDPLNPEQQIALLMLGRCGVATSGRDYRRWRQEGVWKHHIIDPRSGLPAQTDVLSATVIAPTAIEAEAAAKTALILGSQAGLDWLEARPPLAGLLALEDGRRLYSSRMENYLWRE